MNYTLYGIALGAIILGVARLLQDKFGVGDEAAGWVRAIGAGLAFVLVDQAAWIEGTWPQFPFWFKLVGGFVGTVLTVKGYWPEVQRVGHCLQSGSVAWGAW